MASADVRIGISSEVKNSVITSVDHLHFLGYDDEDRVVLYTLAVALATRYKMVPKAGKFIGLSRMESIPDEELTQLLLMYLSCQASQTSKPLDDIIEDIGESRRKETVLVLNQLANAGFMVLKEKLAENEEVVITELLSDMDDSYQELLRQCPDLKLPAFHKFDDGE